MQRPKSLPTEGFVGIAEILREVPIGRSTYYLWVRQGRAPPLIALGPRRRGMPIGVFRAWLSSLEQGRPWLPSEDVAISISVNDDVSSLSISTAAELFALFAEPETLEFKDVAAVLAKVRSELVRDGLCDGSTETV